MKTQTEILVEYNKATREAANAAIKNAATASESVEFLIAKERMRISVEALPLNIPPPDEVLGHVVDYKITFHGPTLATFVEGFAESEITDSIESPTGNITWGISLPHIIPSGAEPGIRIAPLYRRLTQDEIYALFSGTSFMHFRGFICYKDVFDRKRWNRFNRVWQYSRLSRMDGTRWGYWSNCGRPEDNSETEPN
ncbi:MAG TPA: hypothetical protein VGQ12_15745 [Candidatus Angelobacter sp.]|nr:hypothetical protein [Candidatus Angelobacter sp.]